MAIASQSLVNMTVASDNAGGNAGLLMPKLQFRFRVNFINFGVDASTTVLTRQVIDVARPQVQFTEVTLPVYNSTMYVAGKAMWQPITVNLRDDAAGGVTKLVGQQIQKQMDFVEQASAATGQDYKFQMNIEVLDGGNGGTAPVVLETWELYGCFVQTANYNTLNYGTNDPATISLSIRFDNAVQSPLESGVGTQAGSIAAARSLGTSTGVATGIGGTQ